MPKRPRANIPFDEIHACVLNAFKTLGKHGRPADGQRTVLAAWVVYDRDFGPRLVSLATGTKCLAGSIRCEQGRTINDSHAEVLARRCALRWLHAEFRKAVSGPSSSASRQLLGILRGIAWCHGMLQRHDVKYTSLNRADDSFFTNYLPVES
jgi:hypothetical protein